MASCNTFPEGKPLFLVIYATVVAGIVFATLFILSTVYFPASDANPLSFLHFSSSATPPSLPDFTRLRKGNGSFDSEANRNATANIPPPTAKPRNMFTRDIWDVPVGTKMPELKSFRLTKEMLEHWAKENVIIVTFGNYAYMDFILTWVRHLTDLNVYNLLVGAMDTKILEALYWKGIPVFDMGSNMDTMDAGWGSPKFHKMGREKVFLINALLPFGYEVLMCDTDMVWLKNPLPYLARFPEADVLTSSDQVIPTVTDDSLEVWQQVTGAYNVGIFHWRPTDPAKKLAKEWIDLLVADDEIWDQNGFNDLLHKVLGPPVEGESGLVYAFDGTLKLGILPASIFCSGHTFFVQAMHQQLRLEPYAVHTTFQYAGIDGKRHRLREAMLFYDQQAYYDSPGGFLTFKPNIPKSLLLDGPHTVESHFSLVNYQLKQIRTALAIASLLNRTLVMPPLWCRLDRMWFGHPGIMIGTMTRQPFICPMDHVFEVNMMLKELPEAEFGPRIDFREYSFLQNPLVLKEVKESLLEVQLCDDRSAKCQIANETTRRGVLRFPKHSTQQMFIQVFSLYKDVKVLQFSSMEDVFQGFTDEAREEKFRKRVKRYVGLWCCVEHRDRGHIYYDMYWDEKPGWKPEPPQTREDDRPPW
ncbi:arabinosyltransferase XEG113 isoform X2 [Elaeis guineensis]|uniref:Arabinosyltransferase XEG113 isoform X2 n=1 Tax=Elaeis guineensis var. tenera TaxID=51953 RepID=A0A6I9QDY8_ELAGV|nr:arabinosyltransferase XEG113 isoform X2 [Elaeis guineensis]